MLLGKICQLNLEDQDLEGELVGAQWRPQCRALALKHTCPGSQISVTGKKQVCPGWFLSHKKTFFPPPENSVFRKGKPHQINFARTRNGNVSLGPPKNARAASSPPAPPTVSDVAATVQSGMVSRAARFLPKAALWLPVVFRTHIGTLEPMRARLVFLTHADR